MLADKDRSPDLIFLHGGSHGAWCWAPLFEAMAESGDFGRRAMALDMPGCGSKRGRSAEGKTLAELAREFNEELRVAEVASAVLIGHSIAGALMPVMMAEHPALFSHLIYLAAAAPDEGQNIADLMGRGVHDADPERVGFPLDPMTTPTDRLAAAMFGADLSTAQLTWLLAEVAQDVTPPALFTEQVRYGHRPAGHLATYVVTLRDPVLPAIWQRRFAQRLGCDRVAELDTPHEPFISHPRELSALLGGLIRDRRRSDSDVLW